MTEEYYVSDNPCVKCGGDVRYTHNNACIECCPDTRSHKEYMSTLSTEKVKRGKLVNRQQHTGYFMTPYISALSGKRKFYTDKPCTACGHSEYSVSDRSCTKCGKSEVQKHIQNTYYGTPCRVCNSQLRYVKGNHCVKCAKENGYKKATHPDYKIDNLLANQILKDEYETKT